MEMKKIDWIICGEYRGSDLNGQPNDDVYYHPLIGVPNSNFAEALEMLEIQKGKYPGKTLRIFVS